MKEITEKEWEIVYGNFILTYEGKSITERQSASLLQMILACMCQLKAVYLVVVKNATFVVKWLSTVVMSAAGILL